MRLIEILGAAVLSLSLGALPGYAQQEQHEQQEEQKDKPAEQKERAQPEKRPEQPEKNVQQEKNVKPEERNAQQQHTQKGEPAPQTHPSNAKSGTRIPDDRYRANFGREHTFRVTQADYSRNHRFQYGGYWFGFSDPWPSNWLYTQDVFVVEINGVYYLCNPMYPGVNIALNVTM